MNQSKYEYKYFIKTDFTDEQEVTKEQFIKAERRSGFFSKSGINSLATAGFSCGIVSGRMELIKLN